jgi:hypothetical protein
MTKIYDKNCMDIVQYLILGKKLKPIFLTWLLEDF